MTPDAIRALPADQLPQALYAAGLAPNGVTVFPSGALCHMRTLLPWHPHQHIQDAWRYVEQFRISIMRSLYPERGAWYVGFVGSNGEFARTFADIQAMICRVALLCHDDTHYGG